MSISAVMNNMSVQLTDPMSTDDSSSQDKQHTKVKKKKRTTAPSVSIADYQQARSERYMTIHINNEGNEDLYKRLRMKDCVGKKICIAWGLDYNRVPENCVVIVLGDLDYYVVEFDSHSGWMFIDEEAGGNTGDIKFRIKFEPTWKHELTKKPYEKDYRLVKFTCHVYNKSVQFADPEMNKAYPRILYKQGTKDTASVECIGQTHLNMQMMSTKKGEYFVYAKFQATDDTKSKIVEALEEEQKSLRQALKENEKKLKASSIVQGTNKA
jgi:hypothetical protein